MTNDFFPLPSSFFLLPSSSTKILKANIPDTSTTLSTSNFTTVSPGFVGEIQENGCIIFQGGKDGIGHRASGIGHRVLDIGHWALGIGHWALGIGHGSSVIVCNC
ncbi:MAG: hypothetical protein WCD53_10455 [Microcoleus sp.]